MVSELTVPMEMEFYVRNIKWLITIFDMELNSWTLVEQDGEHVLHNSGGLLPVHNNLIHSVATNSSTDCALMPIDVCHENSARNMNRIVIDRRINQGLWRNLLEAVLFDVELLDGCPKLAVLFDVELLDGCPNQIDSCTVAHTSSHFSTRSFSAFFSLALVGLWCLLRPLTV